MSSATTSEKNRNKSIESHFRDSERVIESERWKRVRGRGKREKEAEGERESEENIKIRKETD